VSRHHILPPIIYTPAPPKPKQTRRRRGVGYTEGTSEADETAATGELSHPAPARSAAALPQHSAPTEAVERRIPSTTGKLSDGTLKELLLAQEQGSVPGVGEVVDARIKSGHGD
jgi:hypothetical protein